MPGSSGLAGFSIGMAELPAFARGCAVLGTGGGGAINTGVVSATHAISTYGDVEVLPLEAFDDDDIIVPLGGIGAPTVAQEMIASRSEAPLLRDEVERITGRQMAGIMPTEIGGSNGVAPIAWAAQLGLPLVDADCIGRAFPEVHMVSMTVAALPVNYIVLSDVVGNVWTLRPRDGKWAERQARAACVASGSNCLMADYILTAREAKGAVIEGTISQALAIGRSTEGAQQPLSALVAALGATQLVQGKVRDVDRQTGGGFVRGSVVLTGLGSDNGRIVRLEIQNENLIAFEDGRVLASVPDLITVVDGQSAQAIPTEDVRYGQRVSVLAWPSHPLWRTARGLDIAGPRAFGYDVDFVPLEELHLAGA